MPEFCDVALPVPLDMVFTYRVPADVAPIVGGRVLVPFRQQRMTGIVVELHDRKPSVQIKNLISVLDPAPVLDEQLLHLGRWIADYYLAPIGEVFRTMLPLSAEFKRSIAYRITPEGHMALHQAGTSGSSARSRRTPEEQAAMPPTWHPMVRRHPVSGRKSLYISSIYNDAVEGLDERAAQRLIEDLSAFAAQPKYMYRHVWEPHDVLMWDNRCTVHAVTPHDPTERRVMHRTTIVGREPVTAA